MIKTRLVEISMDKDNALRYMIHLWIKTGLVECRYTCDLWIKKRLVDTPVDKDKTCRYNYG